MPGRLTQGVADVARSPLEPPWVFGGTVLAFAGLDALRLVWAGEPTGVGRIFVASALTAGACLLLPVLASVGRPERLGGRVLATALFLQLAGVWRFSVWADARASSPWVWGGWAVLALLCWRVARLRPRALAGTGLGLAGGGMLLLAVSLAETPPGSGTGRDLLLITLDTTRADALGPYGGSASTPTLDALAAEGRVFERAFAHSPQTGPSHLSLLTGRLPLHTGVVANATVAPALPTLAEHLRQAGYRTAAFVSGYPLVRRFGFARGFDHYDDDFCPLAGLCELSVVRLLAIPLPPVRERRAEAVTAAATTWLAARDRGPVFLWVHYYDPHAPYRGTARPGEVRVWWSSEPKDPAHLAELYFDEIEQVDGQLAPVVAALRERGDPLVVVTADHGEGMGEHGIWFDHGDDLYDPALHVPLILAGHGPPGRSSCHLGLVDVLPTVLSLLELPDPHPRDGVSFAGNCEDRDVVASTVAERREDPPVHHALRRRGGKLIYRPDADPLFFADPEEMMPIEPDPDYVQTLSSLLRDARVLAPVGDAEALEQLEALGYLE